MAKMAGSPLFSSLRSCLLGTECLPRRKPASYRQTEQTHTVIHMCVHTYHKCFRSRLISPFPSSTSLHQDGLLTPRLFGFATRISKLSSPPSSSLLIFFATRSIPCTFVRNAYNATLYWVRWVAPEMYGGTRELGWNRGDV